MPKQHLQILLILALLALPLFLLDLYILKPRGGNWISLNMRGILIVPYIAFVLLHAAISTVAVRWFATTGIASVHAASALLTICLLVAGLAAYTRFDHARSIARWEQRQVELRQLARVIELREWWYEPNAEAPVAIKVRVKVNESGRFAGNVDGAPSADNPGEQIFASVDSTQRQVAKGEEFVHDFPLRFWKEGRADTVTIALYLFKDQGGSAPEDVSIVFLDDPPGETDGHFLYAKLPPAR